MRLIPKTKVCKDCGRRLPLNDYYHHTMPNGQIYTRCRCKSCHGYYRKLLTIK